MKRRLLVLACCLGAACWLASVAAACHSEITASLDCNGKISYTASAWNGSDATTASRTNSNVAVWTTVNGQTQTASGHFGSDDNFAFSGTFSVGSAQSATVYVQEKANWASGDAPAAARSITVTRPSNCSGSGGGTTCQNQSNMVSSGPISISNGLAGVSFSVAQGCSTELSLVAYTAPSSTFDQSTASQQQVYGTPVDMTLSAGSYTWSVAVPNCYYQIDFVYGKPITHLGTEGFYGNRLIKGVNGGTSSCTSTSPGTPPAQNTPPPPGPATPIAPAGPTSISFVKLERDGPTGAFVAGPLTANVGDTIQYELVVTNNGPAVSLSVTDAGCTGLAPTGAQGLETGKSITFTCSHTLVAADGASFTNTAVATATAASGSPVTATAQAVANVASGGVLGASATLPAKNAGTSGHAKLKKVTKVAKPAKAQVKAATFTG